MKKLMIVISILFSLTIYSQDIDQLKINKLDNAIKDEMKISGAPGAVIGVVKDGRIIYEKAFGLCNVNTKMLVDTTTIFQAASVTKCLTAIALLTKLEENKIDVNTPIGNIITDLSPKLSQVTIHQLLSHTAGLVDYSSWTPDIFKQSALDMCKKFGDKLLFDNPDTIFSYSNPGFAIAGLLLSTLNKSSYEDAINDIVFKPLQMTHSTFDIYEAVLKSFAVGHYTNAERQTIPGLLNMSYPTIAPAGGMFTNINDLSRLAICFMNDGIIDEKQVISKNVIKEMSTGIASMGILHHYLGFPTSKYSYGLINFNYKGINFLGLSGEGGYENALFTMAPDYKTAIIIFSNTGYYPFINSVEKAMETFIPVRDETKRTISFKQNYISLIGKYYIPNINGTKDQWIEIVSDSEKLFIKVFDNPTNRFELIQYDSLKFKYTDSFFKYPMEVCFFTDKNGKVKYFNSFWRTYLKED